jgi:hypothetical protein
MPGKQRVRLFIDFWNFQISWNEYHRQLGVTEVIGIPWKDVLPTVLIAEVAKGQPAKFAGGHVYASVDPNNPKDKGLSGWLHHVLASFTGYSIVVKERKARKPVRCPNENCKSVIIDCPNCKNPLKGTVEKGVDAAIITDLISMAFDDAYDIGVLISGDADYAPAVEYIQKKTDKQIVQAFFRQHGDELRTKCWDHVFLDDIMSKLLPPRPKGET